MTEQERIDALRREYTEAIWWVNWQNFWARLASALDLKRSMDTLTVQWNTLRRECGAKGRPRGAPNRKSKPKEGLAEMPLEDGVESL